MFDYRVGLQTLMKYYVMNGSCIVILSKIQIILNSEKYSEAQEF